jgi:hypothetical protein
MANILEADADAAPVGVDAERLDRVAAHCQPSADQGRLPGWVVAVRRHGRLVYVARAGWCDLERRQPTTTTRWSGFTR